MPIFNKPATLFRACQQARNSIRPRSRSRANTRSARSGAVLLAVPLALAACALNTREGDGLVAEESSQNYAFGNVSLEGALGGAGALDAGPGTGNSELLSCKNVPLFATQAQPHLVADCVKCHDGTDLKATLKLALFDARKNDAESQKETCDITLTLGVDSADKSQSTIFTQVDPTRLDVVHDFKYPDVASYTAYRDAVMVWLQTE